MGVGRIELETIESVVSWAVWGLWLRYVWVRINAAKPQSGHLALYSHTYRS